MQRPARHARGLFPLSCLCVVVALACGRPLYHSGPPPEPHSLSWQYARSPGNTEEYGQSVEHPFLAVTRHPRSTFAADVDRASYSNARRFILGGRLPPPEAVRIEEMINYFAYDYAEPSGPAPLAVYTEVAPAPWRPAHRVVRIGVQARRLDTEELPPSNIVFLLDVSGSMIDEDKLPLVKAAMRLLVDQLREEDRVAIVTYAGRARHVLPSTSGDRKREILAAIDRLEAGGSTAGGAGIVMAYEVAMRHYRERGNNRVILATDGDFNVGVTSDDDLIRMIEEKRRSGVFLTVIGVGQGNLKDHKMEQLADHGNGTYAYVDNILEARKVFVEELGGTLHTVAKDVKIQIEFNPASVRAYRLIGYDNRRMRNREFPDDGKDAGDVGSGHSVTALYEIIPVDASSDAAGPITESLRYQGAIPETEAREPAELLYVKVRYKDPDGEESRLLEHALGIEERPASSEFLFQIAVAEFGLLLRRSVHAGDARTDRVMEVARRALGRDEHGDRAEFVRLVAAAQALGLREAAAPAR